MRLPGTAALVLLAAVLTQAAAASPPQARDAATVLAAARAALGGDSLLNAIRTVTVNGSTTSLIGPMPIGKSVEISVELPDKFVRVARHSIDTPGGGFTITDYKGFNGNAVIDAVIAPGAPMPMVIPGPAPKTAAEAQAREERRLLKQKHAFVRFMLPLLASSFSALPLQFESSGQETVEKTVADVVAARAADGTVFKFYIDAATHLPLKLAWMDSPVVIFTTTSTVTTNSRGEVVSQSPVTGPPPPNPATGMPLVEWTVTFSDYKTEAGLTWPRRFVTSTGGKKFEDTRLGKYKINPTIHPRTFEPRK